MTSIFGKEYNGSVINRINKLTPETTPLWGKMVVSQMLAHCQVAIRIAFGEEKIKRGLMGILFGGMAKKSVLKNEPFRKGMPTLKNFIIKDTPDFETEKNKLVSMVRRFADEGESVLRSSPHPFFGKMTVSEWDTLMRKHLDHHLSQFGV